MEVAGDALSFLVGRHGADAQEHTGVVDGDAEGLAEAVDNFGFLLPEGAALIGLDGEHAHQ